MIWIAVLLAWLTAIAAIIAFMGFTADSRESGDQVFARHHDTNADLED